MPCDGTIHTYTGKRYSVINPTPDQVDVMDIAHHLSQIGRFTGATKWFYPVAQHAVLCASNVLRFAESHSLAHSAWLMFCALHHDNPEAYVNDLSRPVKYTEGLQGYRALEDRNWIAISSAFAIPYKLPDAVKLVDDSMCCTEGNQLLYDPKPEHWDFAPKLDIEIIQMTPTEAKEQFLALHYQLSKQLGRSD
jgi:uncharacterized protein